VASCLGVSEFAVKSLVFRATRTLREGIERGGDSSAKARTKRGSRGESDAKEAKVALSEATQIWLGMGQVAAEAH
jgi:hypothetical protein